MLFFATSWFSLIKLVLSGCLRDCFLYLPILCFNSWRKTRAEEPIVLSVPLKINDSTPRHCTQADTSISLLKSDHAPQELFTCWMFYFLSTWNETQNLFWSWTIDEGQSNAKKVSLNNTFYFPTQIQYRGVLYIHTACVCLFSFPELRTGTVKRSFLHSFT